MAKDRTFKFNFDADKTKIIRKAIDERANFRIRQNIENAYYRLKN